MEEFNEFTEGECGVSDINALEFNNDIEVQKMQLQLQVKGNRFYLYKNRLLTYGEAAQIFNYLNYKKKKSNLKIIDTKWTDNEIFLLNWIIIVYSSQREKNSNLFVNFL